MDDIFKDARFKTVVSVRITPDSSMRSNPIRGRPEPIGEWRRRKIREDKMTDKELEKHMFGKDNVRPL